MIPMNKIHTSKVVFAVLFLAVLVGHFWTMMRWSEARGVYDDICYLRQAHLFQRFGLVEGFDTNLAREDDGYQRAKLKEIGYPDWNDTTAAPCHNLMPATGKVVIQYPPGVGLVLALFPPGHQVVPMYMLATIVVLGLALFALSLARSMRSVLMAGAFGCLAIYLMVNPVKASYSMAPTVVVCALAGCLTARWLAGPRSQPNIWLLAPIGFLLGLTVDFRLANLFLASGYGVFLLVAFLADRKLSRFLQGALFGVALLAGVIPTIISYAVNAGSPFASTYGNNPDVRPLDFSFAVVRDYLADPLQTLLIVTGIAGSIWLLRQANGIRRVALLTIANLALNLAFFFTYPIATPYYTIPISLLTLWTLLFAVLFQEATEDAPETAALAKA
ncbi:multisubunit Na+/H+ antiporter MnhC subunit [Bradyrhizobium sp. USDA 3650]